MGTRILGIDPGINHTGWGVVEFDGPAVRLVAGGVIEPDRALPLARRLKTIAEGLSEVCREHAPDRAACEKVFVNMNPQSTLVLGQARGAAITAAAFAGLDVDEYTPSEIKQALTGSGRALKEDIQRIVAILLGLGEVLPSDESDAIACAICSAHSHAVRTIQAAAPRPGAYANQRTRGVRTGKSRRAWTQTLRNKGVIP